MTISEIEKEFEETIKVLNDSNPNFNITVGGYLLLKNFLHQKLEGIVKEKVAELKELPVIFPERESNEYDEGYRDGVNKAISIIENY